jgi:hypothetical protein
MIAYLLPPLLIPGALAAAVAAGFAAQTRRPRGF